jgi:hypothetical protein
MMNKSLLGLRCAPLHTLCVAGLAMLLAACGAGTGGTGSGPPAAAASADSLTASASGSPAAPVALQPVIGVWTQADVSATFESSKISVTQACEKFEFAGDWTLDVNQQAQVQGTYTPCATSGTPANASLVVQLHPAPPGTAPQTLSVLVTDTAGQVLIYSPLLTRN